MPEWVDKPIGNKYKVIQFRKHYTTAGRGHFEADAVSQYEFDEDTTLLAVLMWIGIPNYAVDLEFQVYLDHRAKRLYEGDALEVSFIASHGVHRHVKVVPTGASPTSINDYEVFTYNERMYYILPRPLLFRKGEDIYVHLDGTDHNQVQLLEYRIYLYCSARG